MVPLFLKIENAMKLIELSLLMSAIVLVILPFVIMFYKVNANKVGVKGQWIILKNSRGRYAVGSGEGVVISNSLLSIDHVLVNIATKEMPQYKVYANEDLKKYLFPLLVNAKKINEIQALKLMWQHRDWQTVLSFFSIAASAIIMLMLEFELLDYLMR
jgi:hypothetical protein